MDSGFMNYEKFSPIDNGREMLLTLFVGAIGPEATVESIGGYFERFGKVNKVKIIVDWATKQSKDCALVYFTSQESVHRVLKFPKHIINGRLVRVEPADRAKKGAKLEDASAILVSNIDYFTLHGEVIEYFSAFGQITSCKFFNDRLTEGHLKHAIIRFEKTHSISRVLNFGAPHVVGGKNVSCSLYSDASMQGSGMKEHYYGPSQSFNAQSGLHDILNTPVSYVEPNDFHGNWEVSNQSFTPDTSGYRVHDEIPDLSQVPVQNKNFSHLVEPPSLEREAQTSLTLNAKAKSTKAKSLLFPVEHQKDGLFSIFCDFPRPSPSPPVRWEDTPYSKLPVMKPYRKKF